MSTLETNLKQRVENDVLPRVQKPSRYLGTEINAIHKDPATVDTRVCLIFPDMYDLGLSNLGLLILYNVLNARSDVWCERSYAFALDLERILRDEGIPQFSVESKTPLREFDMLGFTLQYELSYTNILNILDLGGVPVYSADRSDNDPIVIAGGPCVFNPEPLAEFIDAFAIGDGEDVILDMTDAVQATKGRPRRERLEALAAIPGVYVPALFPMKTIEGGWIVPDLDRATPIRKRLVADLNEAAFPTNYIVPFTEQVHDRVSLEVLRGCTQSCRFCQAGMTTRPVRERSLEKLDELMKETIDRTGYEEIALSSLSTCDYSQVRGLVAQSVTTAMQRGASVSLPSLRSDSFSVDLSDMVRTIRQTGLTFAPEAATNRMRAVINKWIPDDDLLAMTEQCYARGWDTVKMYFMIGLPTETDEDVTAIGHLSNRVLKNGRRVNQKARVNLGVSTFIPKPHTPFQWDRQDTPEETHRKHGLLRDILGRNGPKFGRHDAESSFLEGIFSRADRRACKLLFIAWQKGCRFDGWGEHFRWDLWQQAIEEWGLDPMEYLAEIPVDRDLPWDHIDVFVTKKYHQDEYELSRANRLTPDCRYTKCNDCGVIHDEEKACTNMLQTSREGIKIELNWKRPAHLGGVGTKPSPPAPLPGGEGSRLSESEGFGDGTATSSLPEGGLEGGGSTTASPDNLAPQVDVLPSPSGRGAGGEGLPIGQAGSRNAAIRKGQGGAPVIPLEVDETPVEIIRPNERPGVKRLVVTFSKSGTLRFLSHLELNSSFQRTLRRANIGVAMTQGFHPQPRLAFATPLPTGLESHGELADLVMTDDISPEDFIARFNAKAPEGLLALAAVDAPLESASLMARVVASDYEATMPAHGGDLTERLNGFRNAESIPHTRRTKNGPKTVNVRALVETLELRDSGDGASLKMRLVDKPGAKGRPEEVLSALLGDDAGAAHVRKVATVLDR